MSSKAGDTGCLVALAGRMERVDLARWEGDVLQGPVRVEQAPVLREKTATDQSCALEREYCDDELTGSTPPNSTFHYVNARAGQLHLIERGTQPLA